MKNPSSVFDFNEKYVIIVSVGARILYTGNENIWHIS